MLVAPRGSITTAHPVFTWRKVEGATRYEFACETQSGMRVFRRDGIRDTSCELPGVARLEDGQSYRFSVRASNHPTQRQSEWASPAPFVYHVVPPNLPPTARMSAVPTSGIAPLSVQFDGATSSDPETQPLTYVWDFDSDGGVDSTSAAASFLYTRAGQYAAKLTVTDPVGASAVATLSVEVAPPLPTVGATCSPAVVLTGESTSLSWLSANADWVLISPSLGIHPAYGSLAVTPAYDTTYTLTAVGPGGIAETTAFVHVNTLPRPNIAASPASGRAPLRVTLDGRGSADAEGGIAAWAWDFDADGTIDSTASVATTTYPTRGSYATSLTVWDIDGAQASASATVTVTSPLPSARISLSKSRINEGESAQLTWSTTDAEKTSLEPGFGLVAPEGTRAVSPAQSTTFTLDAVNESGRATDAAFLQVNHRPHAVLGADPTAGVAPLSVSLDASGSTDPDGDVLTYAWDFRSDGAVDATGVTASTTYAAGKYVVLLMVTDQYGLSDTATNTISAAHPAPLLDVTTSSDRVLRGGNALLSWDSCNAESVTICPAIGPVGASGTIVVTPVVDTTYTVTATGPGGVIAKQIAIAALPVADLPVGTFGDRYESLTPRDATVAQYDARRFFVVRGRVLDQTGNPLPGARVSFAGAPQYGSCTSDANGDYALPVDGGAVRVLELTKSGYTTANRAVQTGWTDIGVVDDVRLTAEDTASTRIAFDGNASTVMVHNSSTTADERGTRNCTLVFQGDNRAWAVNGLSRVPLDRITVRASEFTTPSAMPAALPAQTAFTYCVDLTAAEASEVVFDRPVVVWVDDFIKVGPGYLVPSGYYDKGTRRWVGSENGYTVRLLDTNHDSAIDGLDINDDGIADDIDGDGQTADEVIGVERGRFSPGDLAWRVEVTHFTPWDFNYAWQVSVVDYQPRTPTTQKVVPSVKGCRTGFSTVDAASGRVGEEIPLAGTGVKLHYESERTNEYKSIIDVPVFDREPSPDIVGATVIVKIAGREFRQAVPLRRGAAASIAWDGKDWLGRTVEGPTEARIRIDREYSARYAARPAQVVSGVPVRTIWVWATAEPDRWGGVAGIGIRCLDSRESKVEVDRPVVADPVAPGWTLDAVDSVSPEHKNRIYQGAGGVRSGSRGMARFSTPYGIIAVGGMAVDELGRVIFQGVDDSGSCPYSALFRYDPKTDVRTKLSHGHWGSIAISPDGGIYAVNEDGGVYRINEDGTRAAITRPSTVTTTIPDGVFASQAPIHAAGIAIGTDGTFYVSDHSASTRIYRFSENGPVTLMAGGGNDASSENTAATSARIPMGGAIAVSPTGEICLIDYSGRRIRRIDRSGLIRTIAGGPPLPDEPYGTYAADLDGVVALGEPMLQANAIAFDAQSQLYVASSRPGGVYHLNAQGRFECLSGARKGTQWLYWRYREAPAGDTAISGSGMVAPAPDGSIYASYFGNYVVIYGGIIQFVRTAREYAPSGAVQVQKSARIAERFDAFGRQVATVDPSTATTLTVFNRDVGGRLAGITDLHGNQLRVERDASGRMSAIVSPDGARTRLGYDSAGCLCAVDYPDGSAWGVSYERGSLLGNVRHPDGSVASHRYDADGHVVSAVGADGTTLTRTAAKTADDRRVSSLSTGGLITSSVTVNDDAQGTIIASANSSGFGVATSTVSKDGMTETRRMADRTVYTTSSGLHRDKGYVVPKSSSVTLPSGKTKTTSYTYSDSFAPDGRVNSLGTATTVNGKTWTSTDVPSQGLLVSKTPAGRITSVHYDPATRLVSRTEAGGLNALDYGWDGRGRLAWMQVGERRTEYSYDTSGNLASVKAPDGKSTAYEYDKMGRMRFQVRPDGTKVEYRYDAAGRLTTFVTPSGVSHEMSSTAIGAPVSYTAPLSGTYRSEYDAARRLTSVTAPSGAKTSYIYNGDFLDRTEFAGGSITYTHLPCGKLKASSRGSETATLTYDGPLVTSETRSGSVTGTLSFGYRTGDLALTSFSYAGSAQTYDYDADGLPVSAAPFTISRRADSGLATTVTAPGFSLSRAASGYGEVDAADYGAYGYRLTRDSAGRIATKTETVSGTTHTWSYAYDALGRLARAERDGVLAESYEYDSQGNRVSCRAPARGIDTSVSATFDAEDRALSVSGASYTYTADGYVASKTTTTGATGYTYTGLGELASVSLPDGRRIAYRYDASGRRVARLVDGAVVERYLWADATRLLATYDASGTLTRRFIYADARMPYAVDTPSGRYFMAYDQTGSLRVVTDSSGAVVERHETDSFGAPLSAEPISSITGLGFAGGMTDADTGLVLFGARDYDAGAGRWMAKDPIGFSGGDVNLYGYCLADPVNLVDPSGLMTFAVGIMGGNLQGGGYGDAELTYVFDSKGNFGIQATSGGGGSTGIGGSIYRSVSWSNAPSIYALEGPGVSGGASGSGIIGPVPVTAGVDIFTNPCLQWVGVSANAGIGMQPSEVVALVPGEVHGQATKTVTLMSYSIPGVLASIEQKMTDIARAGVHAAYRGQ